MISPRLAIAATVLTLAIAVPSAVAASESASATVHTAAATRYANCTAVHRVYSGGIAKAGVTYNTVTVKGKKTHRALKGNVKHDTALYNANSGLDRDKDGIACELD